MKNRNKKIVGAFVIAFTLGLLTACNSFCNDQDSSSYRYGYDSINTSFFDGKNDAVEYANSFITEGYEKIVDEDNSDFAYTIDENGEKTYFIGRSSVVEGMYYIYPCSLKVPSTEKDEKGSPKSYLTLTFSKNSFIKSLETTATSSYINLPYGSFYRDIDEKTIELALSKAKEAGDKNYKNVSLSSLNFKTLYGYSYYQYTTYMQNKNNSELLKTMLEGGSDNIGRNNSLLVKYGYHKYYNEEDTSKPYALLEKWNDELIKEKGANYAMNSDYLALYEKTLTQKVSTLKTCISIDDGLYGHISTDPLNETVYVTNKAEGGFLANWGKAFKEHGFLEGLLVYPIGYGVESLSHSFGLNGWGQIFAVLLMTVIIRLCFMLITLPSTISQQKMTYLQPEIAKLQAKYPNSNTNQYEKQRMAQAQMALYKKNKVHPFLSILVMIIQFPLFISVWNAMTGAASLSRDSVMGLYLSDTIWATLTNSSGWPALPGWWTALVLIILMSGSQIVAMMLPQWLSKKRMKNMPKLGVNKAQNDSQRQMKMVSWVMTGMVIIMGFTLPSAMGVYWFAGALFSIAQTLITQAIINKKKKEEK
jgi:YidC/Oxa1 family membrane protein insertase